MKWPKIITFIAGAIILVPSMAQSPSSDQEAMRGRLFGLGQGLAAATVIGGQPVHIERQAKKAIDAAVEEQYFSTKGLRVVVFKSAQPDVVMPISVEVTTQEALRLIDHDWPDMTRSAIVGNFGPPISQTTTSMHYKGLAEICSDFVDIGLKDEKIVSVKWTFCAD